MKFKTMERKIMKTKDGFRWVSENEWQELQDEGKWKVTSDTWYPQDREIFPTRQEAEARAAELEAALDEKIEEDREARRDDFGVLPPRTNWQADKHFFVSPVEEEEEGG